MSDNLADIFREESAELLTELEDALLELEKQPEDRDAVGRTFRALHTLKGSGAMGGYDEVSVLAHEMETIVEQVRAGRLPVTHELITMILTGRDRLLEMIERPPGSAAADHFPLFEQMLETVPTGSFAADDRPEERLAEKSTYRIRFRPSPGLIRSGMDPLPLLRELAGLGDCRTVAQVEAIPLLDQLDPEVCHFYWDIILTTDQTEDDIRDVFIFVEDDAEMRIELIDAGSLSETGGDYQKIGEILVERGDLSLPDLHEALRQRPRLGETLVASGSMSSGRPDSALAEQPWVRGLREKRGAAESTGIRVHSDKLDILVDLIGEMVTVQARLSQHAAKEQGSNLLGIAEEVERLTWALRDQVLNIRMLPIGTTFSRFRRLVRDLGEELGKEIELVTAGGETELDKTVMERLHEPLVHLIRNCVDHGLEAPEARRAAGKPPCGRIYLSASHSGATVSIEVRDDGAGIDREALRRKAAELGLVLPDQDIPDRELLPLVFLPGFSTAREITSISGRGVGMEVVKRVVDELGGTVEIASTPGAGTTFSMRLPLTLAIIDGLLVQVGDESFIFPLSMVEECVDLPPEAAAGSRGRDLAQVRGELVPYIRLRSQFAAAGEPPVGEQIVITRLEDQRIGFVVDRVIGGHQTVIKSLGRMFRQVKGLSGATILGDGSVALILDPPRLVDAAERRERTEQGDLGRVGI